MSEKHLPEFSPGQLVATPNALERVSATDIQTAIRRHLSGDWGEVGSEDRQTNDEALQNGGRLLSVYRSASGVTFWIITEHDRSATTVLMPEDY